MTKIKQLLEDEVPFYPVTAPEAIQFSDGDSLVDKSYVTQPELRGKEFVIAKSINDLNDKIDTCSSALNSMNNNVQSSLEDIEDEFDNYVLKQTGKGLSTNDYTDSDKDALTSVTSSIQNKINGNNITDVVKLTQNDYEALETKDSGTIYVAGNKLYVGSSEIIGAEGKSAYQVWLDEGNSGDESDFFASLKGDTGETGATGSKGDKGDKGDQGNTGSSVEYPFELVNNLTTDDSEKALSAAQGYVIKGVLDEKVASKQLIDIPFDGGHKHINQTTGAITNNNSWISTQYIPVQEGDVFYYTGKTGTSIAIGGFVYDDNNDTYIYDDINILRNRNTSYTNELVVIPKNITHILVTASTSETYSLKKVVNSELSWVQEGLGDFYTVTVKDYKIDYTWGHYVHKNGNWTELSSYKYLMVNVVPGDVIELYDVNVTSTNCAIIAKKLTETKFEPLIVPTENKTYDLITYEVLEPMTICISVTSYNKGNPRITLIKHKELSKINTTNTLLQTTRQEIADKNAENNILDMQLGVLFDKIAVIGDSMSVGTLDNDSGTQVNSFGASWLSVLAKRWNCSGKFHYAKGGTACYSWLNNSQFGLGRLLKDTTIYNAYFIAYGHNDSASVGSASDEAAPVTITESDGNYTVSCPDNYSFCAYYKAIINQIRTKAPHAMIFCLSEYDGVMVSSKPTYSQAVKDVADYFYDSGDTLVHHLDTGGVNGSGGGMGLGTHYSTIGYAYIAKRVDEEATKCIYEHRNDNAIKYFGGYNTNRTADGWV